MVSIALARKRTAPAAMPERVEFAIDAVYSRKKIAER